MSALYHAIYYMDLPLLILLGVGLLALWTGLGAPAAPSGVAVALLLSLAVEILQTSLRVGYFQTDDLLCNLLGCLVGAVPCLVEQAVEKRKTI